MTDGCSLTILHISDMQFGRHHQFGPEPDAPPNEFDTLLERIWDDIACDRKRALTLTCLYVPGIWRSGLGPRNSLTPPLSLERSLTGSNSSEIVSSVSPEITTSTARIAAFL
jgi:hypothetical protein